MGGASPTKFVWGDELGMNGDGGFATGNVVGPDISVDGDIVLFNGTTGKIIKDSGVQLVDVVNTPADQGVVHDDLDHPMTRPYGVVGDGAIINGNLQLAHTLGYVMQIGSGTVILDVDASGGSNAGIGLGLWQTTYTKPWGVQGRGKNLSEIVYDTEVVDQAALYVGSTTPPGVAQGYRVFFNRFGISARKATKAVEMIQIQGAPSTSGPPGVQGTAQNVEVSSILFDCRTELPLDFTADCVSSTSLSTFITNVVGHPYPTHDNVFNDQWLIVTSGTGAGGENQISDYVGATGECIFLTPWAVTPNATSKFVIRAKGNYNPDTGVRHQGTPIRIRANSADIDVLDTTMLYAGGHAQQSSPQGGAFEQYPRRLRFRRSTGYNTHGSGTNISNSTDVCISDQFFYNNVDAHDGYFSGYAALRIGNGCNFLQINNYYGDQFWRTFRFVDMQHWIATNLFSKRAGFTFCTINGKDTPNNAGTINGMRAYNSCRFTGHTGLTEGGDDDGDTPDATGVGGIAFPFLTDGTPELNGHDYQLTVLASSDDMIYPGLGRIITQAGSVDFKIVDNSKVGQDFNGARQRLWFEINGPQPTKATGNVKKNSNIYTNAHIQLATMLGRAKELVSFTYYTLPNGGGSVAADADHAQSSVSVCKFDVPCPISIGSMADLSTGEIYRLRECNFDPMYFCPAAGTINTTAGNTAFTGTGTNFQIESGAAVIAGTSRVHLYAADGTNRWLAEMAGASSPTAGTFIAGGARITYSGPYCFSVEQKVMRTFECFRGPTGLIFDFNHTQFNGYSVNPVNLWPTNCKKFNWPRTDREIPSGYINKAEGLTLMIPRPKELIGWRSGIICYLDFEFGEDFVGDSSLYLRALIKRVRLGSTNVFATTLDLTNVSRVAGETLSVPIGTNGPFDCAVPANYVRFGSDQHLEVPDTVLLTLLPVGGVGMYMPLSRVYAGWCPRWMTGA